MPGPDSRATPLVDLLDGEAKAELVNLESAMLLTEEELSAVLEDGDVDGYVDPILKSSPKHYALHQSRQQQLRHRPCLLSAAKYVCFLYFHMFKVL